MIKAIARPKLRDVVASRLRTYIVEEKLQPGDRLPTEAQLAEQFGVSRLSLREATTSLEFLGLLRSKPGLGLTVGTLNLEKVTGYLEFHPTLHEVSPVELINTRVVIETGVLPYVSERMQAHAEIYEELNDINDGLRRARSLKRWIKLDIQFHRRLVEASGLSPLLSFSDLLSAFFGRFRESMKKADWLAGIESHQRMIDELRDGNVEVAREELRGHIEHHKTRLKLDEAMVAGTFRVPSADSK